MTGSTGDSVIDVTVLNGANGLQDLFADESATAHRTAGTSVQMIVVNDEDMLDGERRAGWLQLVSSTVLP